MEPYKVNVWYREGSLIFKLEETSKRGVTRLQNKTTINVLSTDKQEAERITQAIHALLQG